MCLLVTALAQPALADTPQPALQVTQSTKTAGARPVALTVRFQGWLQCQQPIDAPITIVLPPAWKVPSTVAVSSVTVSGRAPAAVTRVRQRISVKPAPPIGLRCDVEIRGPIVVKVEKSANLGNPRKPGRYRIALDQGASLHLVTHVLIGA